MNLKKVCAILTLTLLFSALAGAPFKNLSWDFTSQDVLKKTPFPVLRGSTLTPRGVKNINTDPRRPGGAVLKKVFNTTPPDAFEIKAEVILEKNFKRTTLPAMIFDSKYVARPGLKQQQFHKGFMFYLIPRGENIYRPGAALGFGKESVQIQGRNVTLTPGIPHSLSMLFTATGKVTFKVNGKINHTVNVPPGNLASSPLRSTFADRIGANYQPLGGTLCRLEIKKAPYEPLTVSAAAGERCVFERLEKNVFLHIDLRNFLKSSLKDLTLRSSSGSQKSSQIKVKELSPGSRKSFKLPVDTTLLPGEYVYHLEVFDPQGRCLIRSSIPYTIVPSYGDFLPVLLWGNYEEVKDLRTIGFTHQIIHLFPRQGNFTAADRKKWIPRLDNNLKNGLYTFGTLHAHFRFLQSRRYLRTGKDGKPYPRPALEASHPEVRREFAEAARTTLLGIGDHPAFDGALINSEVRDGSLPSFGSGVEPAAFKKYAGYAIPDTVTGKSPLPYIADPTFPWDRVISDKRKDLFFLRWFWDKGDGWNPLQTLLSRTMHDAVRGIGHKKRFFTFYDPATRVPPQWGSGGAVDMISQWTYTYPDPIKIGQATDEVIAMAGGRPAQKIGSMTQAIWYRSKTAPANQTVKNPPSWLQEEKNAQFISVAPDSLREAFWSKISRRLDAIMYHGVGSLVARTDHKLYRMTNPAAREVLTELNKKVILPLGPVLKKVPERSLEVAILESNAASFYAPRHFPAGWSQNWIADLHLALQWGHFQPGIIYDEHLLHGKDIENLKVLFVPGLEVVTQPVLAALNKLRSRGVILVGDEFTLPALMLDHRIRSVPRDLKAPAETKKKLQKLGKELGNILAGVLPQRFSASNQDLVLRRRGNDKADYVFVVNDKRTFGSYVGQWKLVQEKGLPNSGTVTVHHPAAAAYDLVKHCEIPLQKQKNLCRFNITCGPGDGALILLLDRKIKGVQAALPQKIKQGEAFTLQGRITDGSGRNIRSILPVEVILTDLSGRTLPGSGFYATAPDGSLTIKERMAANAACGRMKVVLRCLASGLQYSCHAEITGR